MGGFLVRLLVLRVIARAFDDDRGIFSSGSYMIEDWPRAHFINVKNMVGHDHGNTQLFVKPWLKVTTSSSGRFLMGRNYGNIPQNPWADLYCWFLIPRKAYVVWVSEKSKLTTTTSDVIDFGAVPGGIITEGKQRYLWWIKECVTSQDTVYHAPSVCPWIKAVVPTLTANSKNRRAQCSIDTDR